MCERASTVTIPSLPLKDHLRATKNSASRSEFANGLLTEFPRTSRFQPPPVDTVIRETPAQMAFPTTRHHQKNDPGAI